MKDVRVTKTIAIKIDAVAVGLSKAKYSINISKDAPIKKDMARIAAAMHNEIASLYSLFICLTSFHLV